ncbi:MAG: hypothetical protein WCH98_22110 [Verrucomicrobiota bacterium]
MKLLPLSLALMALPGLLTAGDTHDVQVITLKDRSVIRAQVTEMSGGFYLVKSPLLGDMKIPTGEVISIQQEAAAVQSAGAADTASKSEAAAAQPLLGTAGLESLKSTLASKVQDLVSTREGMNAVMDFSQNPDLKAVMNDPQVMKAIQNGDYSALMKSQAMKSLLDNPRTKALIQSVMTSQSTPQSKASPEKTFAPAE